MLLQHILVWFLAAIGFVDLVHYFGKKVEKWVQEG